MKRTVTWIALFFIGVLVFASTACHRASGLSDSNGGEVMDSPTSLPLEVTPKATDSNSGVNSFEEVVFSTSAPIEAYEVPQRWVETVELNDMLDLVINVPIEYKDSNIHPVYAVSRKKIDHSFLLSWILAVFPNTNSVRKEAKSIVELQNELLRLDRGMYAGMDQDWNPVFEPYDEEEKSEMQDIILEQIAALPTELTFLPLVADNIVLQDIPIGLHQTDGSLVWMSGFVSDTGSMVFLNTEHDPNIQRESWLMQGERMPGGPGPIDNVELMQSEAEEIASSVFKRYGRDDYQLAYVQKARNVSIFPTWGNISSEGWYLVYIPANQGEKAAFYNEQDVGAAFRPNQPYTKGLPHETVEFYISGSGIEQVAYSYPYVIDGIVNENVPLLPFETIQEIIRTLMKQGYEWITNNNDGIGDNLIVSRIVLTETIVPTKDHTQSFLKIPVWAVYYQSDFFKEYNLDDNVLLINAIDGSLIRMH